MTRTRCLGIWEGAAAACVELISGGQVDHDASLGGTLQQGIEGLG